MIDVVVVPLWTDLLAVGIGSLQGAMFAAKFQDRRLDLLGVGLIGTVTGLGGSFLRDLLLNQVPAALSNNWYLPTAMFAAVLGMLLEHVFDKIDGTITFLDSLTVGLYGAIGTTKALANGLPVIPASLVGIVAAVGGSALRDLFMGQPIAVMHVGSLYAAAALVGTVVLVTSSAMGSSTVLAAALCISATTVIRMCSVKLGWSIPEQRSIRFKRRFE